MLRMCQISSCLRFPCFHFLIRLSMSQNQPFSCELMSYPLPSTMLLWTSSVYLELWRGLQGSWKVCELWQLQKCMRTKGQRRNSISGLRCSSFPVSVKLLSDVCAHPESWVFRIFKIFLSWPFPNWKLAGSWKGSGGGIDIIISPH